MAKYPLVLPYMHTKDRGLELRYMLRSLKNVENFNGKVYVIGGKENWFKNINHYFFQRRAGKPYLDQVLKMQYACFLPEMPAKFIATMDDVYITEPTKIDVYYRGELGDEESSLHKRTKKYTKDKLISMELPTLDFECHAPMLVTKRKLLETIDVILADEHPYKLQWRSLYGNMHNVDAELIEDKKTKTNELRAGAIISTSYFTSELEDLFKRKSRYEI